MARFRVHRVAASPVLPAAERRGFFLPRARGWIGPASTVIALVAGCGADRHAPRDDAHPGSAITRIVSTVPAVTELVVALGAADRMVARTDWDTDVRLAHLPSLGRTLTPGAEPVVALRPDLVIVDVPAPALRAAGLQVVVLDVQTLPDLEHAIARLGALLDVEARADSLRRALTAGLAAVRRDFARETAPRVLFLIWQNPPQAAGPGTYIDELIAIAGGANVLGDVRMAWPQLGVEDVVARNPDVLVLAGSHDGGEERALLDAPGWRDLDAVRRGRVIRVDPDLFHRPGPRVVEAARWLGRALSAQAGGP